LLNKKLDKPELEKTFDEIEKSDKRFKLAMIVIIFIVSFAAAMIFISLISSL
jgi:hypothetical protein